MTFEFKIVVDMMKYATYNARILTILYSYEKILKANNAVLYLLVNNRLATKNVG